MPIRLIGTIILLILVTIFAGVNLDNKCDITFVFYTFKDIPVFMTVIVSFAVGAVLMLPFTLGRGKKKKNPPVPQTQNLPPKEESKTLFDFKIKKSENGKKKIESEKPKTESENPKSEDAEKPKKDKKSLFGFGKKKTESADSKNSANSADSANAATSESHAETSDAATTGAPV